MSNVSFSEPNLDLGYAGKFEVVPATVSECEISQTGWNEAVALAGGGWVWEELGLRWAWQAHNSHLMLNFPRAIDAIAAERGVQFARDHRARIIGGVAIAGGRRHRA